MVASSSSLSGTVAILGCGLMGVGIAQVCISSGYSVHLYGRNEKKLSTAVEHIKWGLTKMAQKKREKTEIKDDAIVSSIVDSQLMNLHPSTHLHQSLQNADFVIEAVVEDLQTKKDLFKQIESSIPPSSLLITNTSSIRLADLLDSISSPSQFAGLHFFNPVPILRLVEVISTEYTSDETKQKLHDFCVSIGKVPVSCQDTPGFIVNRLLVPYLIESIRMVERGDATKEDIDAAMRWGTSYPMGPLELCDHVGLDTIQNVMKVWRESMPDDTRFVPCKLLDQLVQDGKLGKKTKQGFYSYK